MGANARNGNCLDAMKVMLKRKKKKKEKKKKKKKKKIRCGFSEQKRCERCF